MRYAIVLLLLLVACPALGADRADVEKVITLLKHTPVKECQRCRTLPEQQFTYKGVRYAVTFEESVLYRVPNEPHNGLREPMLMILVWVLGKDGVLLMDKGVDGSIDFGMSWPREDSRWSGQEIRYSNICPMDEKDCHVVGAQQKDSWQKRYDEAIKAILASQHR